MVKLLVVIITIMNDVIRRGREGVLPLVGCWFNFQIVNSLLINLHILLRYPTPKFYFLMGPHAMPVGIKTWGQDDIMFKSESPFRLPIMDCRLVLSPVPKGDCCLAKSWKALSIAYLRLSRKRLIVSISYLKMTMVMPIY